MLKLKIVKLKYFYYVNNSPKYSNILEALSQRQN